MPRIAPRTAVGVIIGAGGGTGFLAPWATVGAPTQCVTSQAVQNLTTLTPYLIVNGPYLGHANGTWTRYANTSTNSIKIAGTVESVNGSVTYLFQGTTWMIGTNRTDRESHRTLRGSLLRYWDRARVLVHLCRDHQLHPPGPKGSIRHPRALTVMGFFTGLILTSLVLILNSPGAFHVSIGPPSGPQYFETLSTYVAIVGAVSGMAMLAFLEVAGGMAPAFGFVDQLGATLFFLSVFGFIRILPLLPAAFTK